MSGETYVVSAEDDADSPWPIFTRLIEDKPQLSELRGMIGMGVRVAFMFRLDEWQQAGVKTILGTCYMPSVQGSLRGLFEQLLEDVLGYWPDYLFVLNRQFWIAASDRERQALVFHEALHAWQARDKFGQPRFNRQTGMPILGMRPHDLEEFNAVLTEFGAWKGDIRAFLDAANRLPAPNEPPAPPVLRPLRDKKRHRPNQQDVF